MDCDYLSAPAGTKAPKIPFSLLALALGGFTIGTTEFATMGILTNIADGLQVTIPAAGNAITTYALGVVIGAPLIAVLSARMNRTRLIVWLMAAYSVANLLSAFAPNLELLMLGRFLAGLPHGVFFGVGAVIGTSIAGSHRRGYAISIMLGGLTIANVVGVPISSWVGQNLGWRATFIGVGVLGFVTLFALLVALPKISSEPGATKRTELAAMKNGRLWGVFLACGVGFGGMFTVYSYIKPMAMEEAHLSVEFIPVLLAIFGIGMTVGIFFAGRMMDISVYRTVYFGFITTALALIFLGLVGQNKYLFVLAIFLVGYSAQFLALGLQGMLMDLSPTAPSLGAALCHSALNTANANGAFMGGLVITWGFGYLALAWLGVILTVVGMVMVYLIAPKRKKLDIERIISEA